MNKCEWCNKELSPLWDQQDCCSDCWNENKEYYE